jgi:pyruvate dehydrogenase E2 component (dihydrolipoamide acetyltransferase)
MATDVIMPRLSDSMEEGTVLKWLVEEGAEVKRGEPLVEIETDKANMTYEADTDGTLIEVVASEGDTLPIGEVIARVGEPGEASQNGGGAAQAEGGGDEGGGKDGGEATEEEAERDESAVATAQESGSDEATGSGNGGAPARDGAGSAPAPVSDGDGRIKASPVARRIAGEQGVDLSALDGSGPGGRIVKADVLAAADGDGAGPADPAPAEQAEDEQAPEPQQAVASGQAGPKGEVYVQELTRLQQTVSRRMAESKATAPDFTLEVEVEMGACIELRKRLKEVADPVPSINDMIIKACALTLREYPRVNGAYRDGQFELYEKVNIGIAVAAKDTLVVPTIFDTGSKSLGEITRAAHEAIKKVRDDTITPPELSGGTFTVSNLGMFGIDRFSAVINPPQAAILTVGAFKKKPAVDDSGRVVARDMATLSLVSDHRILYGADAAQFLARVREALEQPLSLAL